jgi:hypothetical protein
MILQRPRTQIADAEDVSLFVDTEGPAFDRRACPQIELIATMLAPVA